MNTLLILAAITLATLLGDWCIKLASGRPAGLASPVFWAGALLYGLPALGWFFLMRSHSLAAIGVFYSAATILMLAGLGTLAFGEPFGWRQALGVGLALAAVVVINQ